MEFKKITLPFRVNKSVLALGSSTKNTVAFLQGNSALISPVHADLDNPRDFLAFKKQVKYFLKKHPRVIAYDLHPEYQSSKYALTLKAKNYELKAVQHHHAHIASCMLDNKLRNTKVIGCAFDGTGLGTDNRIWGAEFLICDFKRFKRCAHLKEVPLLGAEKAILEPYRIAAAWLYSIYKEKIFDLRIDFTSSLDKNKWHVLRNMYILQFNSPLASSMGRLFDAAGSLVSAKYKADFEAELAVALEKLAWFYKQQTLAYEFKLIKHKGVYIIDPGLMFRGIVKDLQLKAPKVKIAYRFHLTVAQMIKQACLVLRKNSGLNKVVLSGGVFQNKLLLALSLDLLYKQSFKVYTHRDLSCNDSCVSLGQGIIAAT